LTKSIKNKAGIMGVCASTAGLEITANKSSAEEVYGVYGDQAESTSVSQRHTLTQSSRSNAALSRKLVRDNTGNEDGSRLHDHYELVGGKEGVLGVGVQATIRLVSHKKSGRKYALKTLEASKVPENERARLFREVDLIRALDHPNIIRLVETFSDASGDLHLILTLATGGDLFEYLQLKKMRVPEQEVWGFAKNMFSALQYMVSNNVVHRDIKLENYVFSSKDEGASLMLVDFGFSRSTAFSGHDDEKSFDTAVGTLYTMAPEVVDEDAGVKVKHSEFPSDVWSVGVVLYSLLYGSYPFGAGTDSNEDMIDDILYKQPPYPSFVKVSKPCKALIARCFEKDATKRITAEAALEHKWLKKTPKNRNELEKSTRSTSGVRLQRRLSQAGQKGEKLAKIGITKDMFVQMTEFQNFGTFKKLALLAVAQCMDHEKIAHLTDAFAVFDINGDGTVTWEEFFAVLKENNLINEDMTESHVKDLFRQVDQDNTGYIKYTEFIAGCIERQHYTEKSAVAEAFRLLDLDRRGGITKENLIELLRDKLPRGESKNLKEIVDDMFDEADLNNDGVVDEVELDLILSSSTWNKTVQENLISENEYSGEVSVRDVRLS
jgi:calcium-dependent protein kinase